MSSTPIADGLQIELPEEPAARRASLRTELLETPRWRDHLGDESAFGTWLWERWGPTLAAAGMDRAAFVEVVRGDSRELWYWAMGERPWGQFVSGLAGRVSRRLPAR